MLKTGLHINQKQSLQQRLSPQQIQYIKLLQLPTMAIEMRVKEELEANPVLEEMSYEDSDYLYDSDDDDQNPSEVKVSPSETDPVDDNKEIDWDSILHSSDYEGSTYQSDPDDFRESTDPYLETFIERLERQIAMLAFTDKQLSIAEEVVGSLDEDGYLRREVNAIAESFAFHGGFTVTAEKVLTVIQQSEKMDPPGSAA